MNRVSLADYCPWGLQRPDNEQVTKQSNKSDGNVLKEDRESIQSGEFQWPCFELNGEQKQWNLIEY